MPPPPDCRHERARIGTASCGRSATRQQLVEHGAELGEIRVDVESRRKPRDATHVVERIGPRSDRTPLDAEPGDLRREPTVRAVEEHAAHRQSTVQDAGLVRVPHAAHDPPVEVQRVVDRRPFLREVAFERAPLDELHDEPDPTGEVQDVGDRDDVGGAASPDRAPPGAPCRPPDCCASGA